MKTPFYITGLPRSRSCWLANFFTTQTSFCLHDACKDGWTAEFIRDTLNALPTPRVGDADSGLMMITAKLVEYFPNAHWLFIANTPERAAASYRKWFTPGNEYPGIPAEANIEAIMAQAQTFYPQAWAAVPPSKRMEVAMDDLDQPGVMRACWEWCVPGMPWDEARYQLLDTFCVNILPQKVTVKLDGPATPAPVKNSPPWCLSNLPPYDI
jgi:hypothetical protein